MTNTEIVKGLKVLLMPSIRENFERLALEARKENLSYEQYLHELVQIELIERYNKRTKRFLKASLLPLGKSLDNFDLKRIPEGIRQHIKIIIEGNFINNKENVLIFGNPGSGKTHLMCGIGQELIRKGYKCLFKSCSILIQELLSAKLSLKLPRLLKKFTSYDVLILDEIGYIQQTKEEMEVLFTFLTECYETTSVLITSNLPFSKWENIFKDTMMAAAVIDRLIHHSVILELNLSSYRLEHAVKNKIDTNNSAADRPSSSSKARRRPAASRVQAKRWEVKK